MSKIQRASTPDNIHPAPDDLVVTPATAPLPPTPSPDPPPGGLIDLEALRLPQNFTEMVGVQQQVVSVSVRKPNRQEFVRVRPEPEFQFETAILRLKNELDGTYLLAPELWPEVSEELTPTLMVLTLSRQKAGFLWPLRLPGADGRLDSWSASAREAATLAQNGWVSVRSNRAAGAYDVFRAAEALSEPEWPDLTMAEAINIAFKDHYINSPDHPVLRQLRGEV